MKNLCMEIYDDNSNIRKVKYECYISNAYTSDWEAKPYKLYAYGFKQHDVSFTYLYTSHSVTQIILFRKIQWAN